MQLEGSSEECVQLMVCAPSFVYFCHAISANEQSREEHWWVVLKQRVQVFLKLSRQRFLWCSVSRRRDETWCAILTH